MDMIIYVIICLILGIGLTIYGFTFGFASFAPNFIAGWGQFFFELLISIFIIDKFIKKQSIKQWAKVQHIHYRILSEHLIKLLIEISLKLNYTDIVKNLMYKKKVTKNISSIIESLVKELSYLDSLDDIKFKDIIVQYSSDIKEEIKEIRTEFIPRIIEHSDNQELIDKLSELDLLLIKFEDDIVRVKCKENTNVDFMRLINLVECIGDIIGILQ